MSEETKALAAKLFNDVWALMDKEGRSEEENYLMVHMVHASLYHWIQVGTPHNIYVGEWQVSRVYALLGNFDSCLYHGKRALHLCEVNGFGGFDLAYAYEALARAYLVKGNKSECTKYLELALREAEKVENKEDKEILTKDLDELQNKIMIQFMN
ncbi:hypothetical protein [Anaerocolumna xylanovorans]|uniref:Tetratricopeptide repeat-containing protein n=1 Tax=Anaerocolumna xylanovorans DSM 12503 TaxID=1121345 RepID=A0A1M7YK16_9FIRM|nr:hypothetical protein [Anaerocolumna xylanovorans]SHO52926.1 hypothetical protein SAMN02745217_03868 [Anaerocolumna xylanovorans DSM 12503]